MPEVMEVMSRAKTFEFPGGIVSRDMKNEVIFSGYLGEEGAQGRKERDSPVGLFGLGAGYEDGIGVKVDVPPLEADGFGTAGPGVEVKEEEPAAVGLIDGREKGGQLFMREGLAGVAGMFDFVYHVHRIAGEYAEAVQAAKSLSVDHEHAFTGAGELDHVEGLLDFEGGDLVERHFLDEVGDVLADKDVQVPERVGRKPGFLVDLSPLGQPLRVSHFGGQHKTPSF